MDLFTERLMKKKISLQEGLLTIAVLVAGVAICVAAFLFFNYTAIVILAAVAYGVYYLLSRILFKEYEYILTNSVLDIDIISAKSDRKRLYSLELTSLESGGVGLGGNSDTTAFCCPYKKSDNLYYLMRKSGGKLEKIIIDPNDTMKKAFERYMGARFLK